LLLLLTALPAWSPVHARDRLNPGLIKQLARPTEAGRFVDAGEGLAIVAEQCGDSDEPPPMPRRACGDGVAKALARLSRDLRRRLHEEGPRVTCTDRECTVMGTSEYDASLHLVFDSSPASSSQEVPRLIGWFEVCFASAGAQIQEQKNRRRMARVVGCASPK
jgi:hypothetical protein